MTFKNREEIKEILDMNIDDRKKRNLIANLKNYRTDIGRIILTHEELDIRKGQIWDNQGLATSWTDRNADNVEFRPENNGNIKYVLHASGIAGYQVQYFDFGHTDEEDEMADDEVYQELMHLLGSDGSMWNEAEILVPAETQFRIVEINDGREDVGYIEVILEEIQ